MTWKIQKRQSTIEDEKMLITGMIISTEFLQQILPIVNIQLLKNKSSVLVATWCVDYFKHYAKAPEQNIQELFEGHKNDPVMDEDVIDKIEIFLQNLNDTYVQDETKFSNVKYMLDKAENYLRIQALEQHAAQVKTAISTGNAEQGEHYVSTFQRVGRPECFGMDILRDQDIILETLSQEDEELLQLPGALGNLLGPFMREDLVAVAGPAKRGKTFWLIEIGLRALLKRKNVLHFSFEMPRKQMLNRIYQYMLGETRKKMDDVAIPYFASKSKDDYEIDYKYVSKKGLSPASAIKKANQLLKYSNVGRYELHCAPAGSMSTDDMHVYIDNLERYNNFVPDVIIADYADIMSANNKRMEKRHQIDDIWMGLRGMAQDRRALVVTATHTGRATFGRDATAEDIVEDTRKLNHVACMFALNQKSEDREKLSMRVQVLVGRHMGYGPDEALVLQQLEICKPYIDSKILKKDFF